MEEGIRAADRYTGRSVSLDQASAALQKSRRTLYYWIRDGRLQTVRTPSGAQRVLRESLNEALGAGRAAGGGESGA